MGAPWFDAAAEDGLAHLKQGIQGIIDTKIKEGKILYVSVYFRDLLNGPWLGINEKEGYQPASLMKVPLMIAYLKYAQENPGVLSYELKYEKPVDYGVRQNILPEKELVIGESYTVDELIYRMIVYSDNAAKDILLNSIDSRLIDNVYSDIEFELENDSVVTVKEYASFFRILFNASYLNREISEKALDILSKSSFKAGIRAGVPSDVVVANKFGEKGDEQNKTFQVHDCGIIYHKYRPYLICIMTDSTSFVDDSNIIREISGFVYQEIDSYYAVRTKK